MAGKLRTRRSQIAMKLESVEGTEEALAAADAFLIHNPTYSPNIEKVARTPARATLTPLPHIVGKQSAGIGFGMELKGTGDVTVAPDWAQALLACGFEQRVVNTSPIGAITGGPFEPGEIIDFVGSGAVGVSVGRQATGVADLLYVVTSGTPTTSDVATGQKSGATATHSGVEVAAQGFLYTPISTGEISVTTAHYLDGVMMPIAGARGTFSIAAQNGGLGMFNFNFTGKYIAPTDTALLSGITYEEEVPPAVLNVGLFTDEFAPVFASFGYNHGGQVSAREDASDPTGFESHMLVGRAPAVNIDPEMTLVADNDWYGKVLSGVQSVFHAELGAGAGSKVIIASPTVQYANPSQQNRNSIAVVGLNLPCSGSTVNTEDDEIQIAVV